MEQKENDLDEDLDDKIHIRAQSAALAAKFNISPGRWQLF
jgi:hypothetical protein